MVIAGEIRGIIFTEETGDATWRVWATGTQSPSLKGIGEIRVHICQRPCERLVWAVDLIHGERFHDQGLAIQDWWRNLGPEERAPTRRTPWRDCDGRLREEQGR